MTDFPWFRFRASCAPFVAACLILTAPLLRAGAGEGLPVLTSAEQVRALAEEDARHALPVRLSGVFMGEADPEGIAFVVQDRTEGIYVQGPAEQVAGLRRGDLLEIEGITDPGGFAPYVVARSVRKVGHGELPAPIRVTLDDLNAGQMDARWVEFSGVVRSVEPKSAKDLPPPPPGTRYTPPSKEAAGFGQGKVKLKIASGGSRVTVQVNEDLKPEDYVDAEIRVRGLCFNLHNNKRQFVRAFVQVPSGSGLAIVKAPPPKAFQDQPFPVAGLMQFHMLSSELGHRVHVRGVVLHHQPGVALWLRDRDSSLRIASALQEPLSPGDEVDVLGFPVRGDYSAALEDAVYRKLSSQGAPAPHMLSDFSGALQNDAELVQLEARLADVRRFADGVALALDWQGSNIRAQVRLRDDVPVPADWMPGSQVRLTGICRVTTEENGPLGGLWEPTSFQLLVRTPADLTLLRPPPWWSAERVVYVLSGFLAVALVAVAFVMTASRRRLKEQEHRRAMAETEFTAILSERNRVAREIHDTLSQSLGAISVQLELARTRAGEISAEARNHLGVAHKLTRAALAEARESIWNMRSQVLEKCDLGEALEGILMQMTEGTGVQPLISVEGSRRRLPPVVENNLLRIGQEAITNASRHAKPTRISVSLGFEGRSVRLVVEDDGVGFTPGAKPGGERRGFGLVGMQERVELLGGTVEITSSPGHGTRLLVTISV